MSLISIIHPSRSRSKKSFHTTRNWIQNAGCDTELIVSIDSDDLHLGAYEEYYGGLPNTKLIINPNDCVVQATNHAAAASKGDILIYCSDDFAVPNNWGQSIIEMVQYYGPEWLLRVDDGLQKITADVLTIPIMSRTLYERLGYFFHPAYRSMWVDCDLFWTAKNLGVLKYAEHLKFPHEHYCNGKAVKDETYSRSERNWDAGKALYEQRKRQNFPL